MLTLGSRRRSIELCLEQVPDAFASVLVLLRAGDEWILVRNRYRAWEFPGGHREAGESAEDTARREAFEEAGVEIDDVQPLGHYRLPDGHTTVVVLATVRRFLDIPAGFETTARSAFRRMPPDLSWKDGLYERLLEAVAAR
jgi:8-oxo-dGTP diphosphatase